MEIKTKSRFITIEFQKYKDSGLSKIDYIKAYNIIALNSSIENIIDTVKINDLIISSIESNCKNANVTSSEMMTILHDLYINRYHTILDVKTRCLLLGYDSYNTRNKVLLHNNTLRATTDNSDYLYQKEVTYDYFDNLNKVINYSNQESIMPISVILVDYYMYYNLLNHNEDYIKYIGEYVIKEIELKFSNSIIMLPLILYYNENINISNIKNLPGYGLDFITNHKSNLHDNFISGHFKAFVDAMLSIPGSITNTVYKTICDAINKYFDILMTNNKPYMLGRVNDLLNNHNHNGNKKIYLNQEILSKYNYYLI